MVFKARVAKNLYSLFSTNKISLHQAIKLYRPADMYLSRNMSDSGKFVSKNLIAHLLDGTSPSTLASWASVLFPAELLYPFKVFPLTLEVIAGTFSTLGLSPIFLDKADANDVPNTMCSFHRILIGLSYFNFLKKPIFVGATSSMCDGNVKSFAEVAKRHNVPFIFIDVPYEHSDDGVAYVKKQLEDALSQISELSKSPFRPEILQDMAKNSNEAFHLARKFYKLRQSSNKNVFCFHEIANSAFPMHFLLGSRRLVDILNSRCKDVESGIRRNKFFDSLYFPKSARRIMWLHIVPQYNTELWDIIDNGKNSRIVCDDYSSPYFEDYDLSDPLGSVAKRLISHPSNGPIDRRIAHILKVASDFKVDGIIHYSSWGCHQASGNVQIIEKNIENAGYKFLNLNGDAADPRNTSIEQHRTRIEAFLEGF